MASTLVLLLLVLVSLASASHYFGGSLTFTYKGRNPDGTFKVDLRNRATFDGCQDSHYWYCYNGNCGGSSSYQVGVLDRSSNAPQYNREWCETERVTRRNVPTDRPFQMRADSCCWISTRNGLFNWKLLTSVDLGSRSDTGQPNHSPDIAILPFLRVPQNCPRTYKLMSFDPDGDRVRCRYGSLSEGECSTCNQPSGFILDEGSCSLHYLNSNADPSPYGFELVVEDFPQRHITLAYTDGGRDFRAPLTARRKRQVAYATTTAGTTAVPWWSWWYTTAPPTTTAEPTTTAPPTAPWGWGYTYPGTTRNLQATTPPLSKLPLQFSVLVDPPAPSCQEGHYLPQFVHPTPAHGARIQAEINKEVEIRVKAQAAYATIHGIIISGPMNISKHQTGYDEFVIRWSPTLDDLGDHYPICFAVEAVTGASGTPFPSTTQSYHYHPPPSSQSGVYQSEMRCVLVDIRKEQVKSHVICGESSMTVSVEKSSFRGLSEENLRLSDSSNTACSLQRHSNSTHIVAVVPLNACGTQIEENGENLIFKNTVTLVTHPKDVIIRKCLLELKFECNYPKSVQVKQSFSAHRKNVIESEKGLGTFTYKFEFYPDKKFLTPLAPDTYPLDCDSEQTLYMQIEVASSIENTELFVESCSASPYDIPNYKTTYPIIDKGCAKDPTVVNYSRPHDTKFQFSMEAFKFIGLHEQVYISCSVMICRLGQPDTRCSQGCVNSRSRRDDQHHHLIKREVVTQSSRHFVSQGPLRLRRSAESPRSPGINLNMNLVFIAGCLLAAVGMISSAVIYKAKMSRDKYQPLPSFED
ncbi:uncharacterized protein LOC117935911 isoform X8 [Etheostoma cragini]|uniref:uncharacterized protein LOC117935911 isoform X8 n=1 Tax=Etheostoma cragini TaxID=417921 RepID=UPI00155F46FB|nr:uncharacterized protein LOC117935911 isoform X8 [Etheostoma cragini]